MIHFTFTEKDNRYVFLKFDNTPDEYIVKRTEYVNNIVDGVLKREKVEVKWHALEALKEHMNLVDPICYLPTYTGPPFTQDFLFEFTQPTGKKIYYCAIGLWQDIYMFLKTNNIPYTGLVENQHFFKRELKHTYEEFKEIVDSWGLKYKPREYQYEAAYKILQWYRSTSQLATRAGKTLIAYIIFRYEMEYMGMKRILAIVPSIDLVKQMYNDFNEYKEFFKTECVWSGGKLVESANITVGTFQSLIKFLDRKSKKYDPTFFDGYDCVFVDETHRASAAQIKTIISQPFMKDVKIAFGMSGTLPSPHTIEHYCVRGLLGAKIQEVNPRELMDAGYISDIEINQCRLHYDNIEKQRKLFIRCAEYALSEYVLQPNPKNPRKKDKVPLSNPEFLIRYKKSLPIGISDVKESLYNTPEHQIKVKQEQAMLGYDLFGNEVKSEVKEEKKKDCDAEYISTLKECIVSSPNTNGLVVERMMSHFMNDRIDYLCNEIIPLCDKNTLILAHHTEYINYFAEIVKAKFPNRHIDVITGSVSSKRRDEIKQMLKDHNDCILIASYGVMSTGITLANLCFGVLFESFKSNVINMQSLGRGLGLSDLKEKYVVYDIIDCFNKSEISDKILAQGKAKIKIYKENCYKYNIINKHI